MDVAATRGYASGGVLTFYFAYGSNMNTRQMAYRCPRAEPVGVASLEGYSLAERAYADIDRDPQAIVWGVLWRVPVQGLSRLDTYEGCPGFYRRFETSVVVRDPEYGSSPPVNAWVYEMAPHCKIMRAGDPWDEAYRQACAEGAREHGLPVNAFTR